MVTLCRAALRGFLGKVMGWIDHARYRYLATAVVPPLLSRTRADPRFDSSSAPGSNWPNAIFGGIASSGATALSDLTGVNAVLGRYRMLPTVVAMGAMLAAGLTARPPVED
ncbi:MAG: hypothetical protein ACREDL_16475 [Bradyrhizobium sp.]